MTDYTKSLRKRFNLNEDILLTYKNLSDRNFYRILKTQLQIPEKDLLSFFDEEGYGIYTQKEALVIDEDYRQTLAETLLREERIIPLYKENKEIGIAVDTPFPRESQLSPLKSSPEDRFLYHFITEAEMTAFWTTEKAQSRLPKKLRTLLDNAINKKASDIHCQNNSQTTKILLRCNGNIYPDQELAHKDYKELLQIVKYHGHMTLGQTGLPEDGQLRYHSDKGRLDCRLSTLPTEHGEDLVIRLFQKEDRIQNLAELGIREDILTALYALLENTHGLFLVTGPTGSGKTSTLYACLEYILEQQRKIIITLEDPIEREINGIRQSQINVEKGYGYMEGLRACLRQDPDVLLIGEIRDEDSAKKAIEAAYTGHFVLATLHSNNCENSLKRLTSLDLDPFLLGHALKGILSQKLIPSPCPNCNTQGCERCQFRGILGRSLNSELFCLKNGEKISTDTKFDRLRQDHDYYPFKQPSDKLAK